MFSIAANTYRIARRIRRSHGKTRPTLMARIRRQPPPRTSHGRMVLRGARRTGYVMIAGVAALVIYENRDRFKPHAAKARQRLQPITSRLPGRAATADGPSEADGRSAAARLPETART